MQIQTQTKTTNATTQTTRMGSHGGVTCYTRLRFSSGPSSIQQLWWSHQLLFAPERFPPHRLSVGVRCGRRFFSLPAPPHQDWSGVGPCLKYRSHIYCSTVLVKHFRSRLEVLLTLGRVFDVACDCLPLKLSSSSVGCCLPRDGSNSAVQTGRSSSSACVGIVCYCLAKNISLLTKNGE